MNFLTGLGQSAVIEIKFEDEDNRRTADVKTDDGKKEKYLLYYDGESVIGKVNVTLKKPGYKLEHQGIKIELIGQIELYYDRGNHHEFLSLVRELARPGDLIQNTSYPFEFANVEKPYEVYSGSNVRLRYLLRVTIVRRLSDIVKEIDIAVHTLCSYPDMNSPIKMEVGIEDCLHIEFEYNKCKYHLKDVIVGKIYFLLVRIKIKHMEIAIIKRETTGSGPNTFTENETIAKYEIMDGAPVKGESIPIRVFLAGYDLTPTMRDINKKFSVKYFLNLVLMDTEDRRYFKQQEITLWRKADKTRKHLTGIGSSSNISNSGGAIGGNIGQNHLISNNSGGGGGSNSSNSDNPHIPSYLVGQDGNIIQKNKIQQFHDEINGISESGVSAQNNSNTILSSPIKDMDPSMGLFTQESPQKESEQQSQQGINSNSVLDGNADTEINNTNSVENGTNNIVTVDINARSENIENDFQVVEDDILNVNEANVRREAGDGAASVATASDDSLFDTIPTETIGSSTNNTAVTSLTNPSNVNISNDK